MISIVLGEFWYNNNLVCSFLSFHTMITIFNIIVSIIGALALGFVLNVLTTPDMKSMRRILRVRSIRKRVVTALAIFALVVLYQWLRV